MSVNSPAVWTLQRRTPKRRRLRRKATVWSPELVCNNVKKKPSRWCPRLLSGSSFSACACAAPRLRQRPLPPCARPRAAATETEALTAPGEDWAPCRAASAPSPTTCESSFSPLYEEPSARARSFHGGLCVVCVKARGQGKVLYGYRVAGRWEKSHGWLQCWGSL